MGWPRKRTSSVRRSSRRVTCLASASVSSSRAYLRSSSGEAGSGLCGRWGRAHSPPLGSSATAAATATASSTLALRTAMPRRRERGLRPPLAGRAPCGVIAAVVLAPPPATARRRGHECRHGNTCSLHALQARPGGQGAGRSIKVRPSAAPPAPDGTPAGDSLGLRSSAGPAGIGRPAPSWHSVDAPAISVISGRCCHGVAPLPGRRAAGRGSGRPCLRCSPLLLHAGAPLPFLEEAGVTEGPGGGALPPPPLSPAPSRPRYRGSSATSLPPCLVVLSRSPATTRHWDTSSGPQALKAIVAPPPPAVARCASAPEAQTNCSALETRKTKSLGPVPSAQLYLLPRTKLVRGHSLPTSPQGKTKRLSSCPLPWLADPGVLSIAKLRRLSRCVPLSEDVTGSRLETLIPAMG
eukprot:scaffold1860_cov403-Prasinococcus_capsulatus_cf.AAC.2